MFQFPGFAPYKNTVPGLQPGGLPHSDTPGSSPVCGSPGFFAAYRVLPRLPKPRHPPCALTSLSLSESFLIREIVNLLYYYNLLISIYYTLPRCNLSVLSKICDLLQGSQPPRSPFQGDGRRLAARRHGRPGGNLSKIGGAVYGGTGPYITKIEDQHRVSHLASRASSCREQTPKRRCSSHTFRYGYLVTT